MKIAQSIGKWPRTRTGAKASIRSRMKMAVSASERQRTVKKVSVSPTPWDDAPTTWDDAFSNQVNNVTLKAKR